MKYHPLPPAAAVLLLGGAWAATVSGAARVLGWEVMRHDTPAVMWADTTHRVRIVLHNPSPQEWSASAGDHLSYHWLGRDGSVRIHDGLRTPFPGPVRPGQVVELEARVESPPSSGLWVLEWDMVREQVAWYGPPPGGEAVRARVLVLRRSVLLQLGLAFGTLALALAARARPAWLRPGGWPLAGAVPIVWTAVALAILAVSFSELARRQLWQGGGWLVASSAALLALPLLVLPGRWRMAGAAAAVSFWSLVAVADLAYLRFFGSIVPIVAAAAVGQVGQIEGSILALLRPVDAWLMVLPAAGIGLAAAWPKPAPAERSRQRALTVVLLLGCVAGATPAVRMLWRGLSHSAFGDQLFSQEMLIGRWGVLNAHLFDLARATRERLRLARPDATALAEAAAYLRERPRTAPGGAARGANLLQVQVESLQGWVIGARVNGQEVTPFLNRLRQESLYFPNLFDQSGQGRSSDGEFITLNSLPALDRGAVSFRRPGNRFLALPAVLREHGYTTLSAHPFERGFWNRAVLHPRYGFEQMLFKRELGPGEVIGWGLADEPFFRKVAARLPALRKPFFAYLITLGLHHPFDEFPDRHKVLDVGDAAGTPLGNYLHAMHYLDASVAVLVEELQRQGLWENTVLALHGDHESGVAIDRRVLAIANEPRWEPSILVRLRKVPFLVHLPGGRLAGDRLVAGGHMDIAPTLLDLLGFEAPACFAGRSLLAGGPSWAVLHDGSAVCGDRLSVTTGPGIPVGGACFAFPDGQPRPLEECEPVRRAAERELELTRRVVLYDLVPQVLAGGQAGHGGGTR
ncbi:MAG TPA: LTA synthase family protein [Thermoanaerobaculaceae bacterium]|nr:LTA synthase family protein [Thermoanaerobaculaceae bacterium]HRS14639.1 LTA synthase family protein [Thermoanaerobaculaceae bacterium]